MGSTDWEAQRSQPFKDRKGISTQEVYKCSPGNFLSAHLAHTDRC